MDLVVFLPLIIILGAFMYFASRRQKKAMQATINLHESLQVGDRVHTTSGLLATIVGVSDDNVDLEIAPGVVTTWMKLAVRDKIEPTTETPAGTPAAAAVTSADSDYEIRSEASEASELTESGGSVDPNRLTKD